MPALTLRDVPAELHPWLKQQAQAHGCSLNQAVIDQLEALRTHDAGDAASDVRSRLERIRGIARRASRLPILDTRSEAEILGLGPTGAPE